ncbi:MAG: condensation domain-containing protein [Acidobacteriota bacterium]
MTTARQLLLRKLRDRKAELLGDESIRPRPDPGPAPLSLAQQRLWFLEQLEPGTPRFSLLTAVRLRGDLDPARLQRAVSEVVRRHEALRTRFEMRDGEPVQVVDPPWDVPLPLIDLSGLAADVREALLHRLGGEEAGRPFNLRTGPLLRLVLLRFGAHHHALLLTMHQISMDRWSRGILVREVGALYDSPLPELPVQYADFAVWQREHPVDERLLDWWKERLLPLPPTFELPTDRPRPAVQSPRGRMQFHSIPQAELDDLHALARREGATLFMVLLAGLAALLHRATGAEDLIVGAPVANRHRPELDGVIGFFLNLLPLRLHPRADLSFRALLAEARETAIGAFAHQEVPFELLVNELGLDRDLSRHPLFQVTLALQNAPVPPLEIPGLTATLVEVDWGTTAFDLALFFWETALWESLEPGLSFVTTASAALFDAATVTRLAGHLRSILRDAAADPDRRLADLLPGLPERRQILAAPMRRRPAVHVEPRTETERIIASVWSKVLSRPVGVEDDFFDLGGHSLQAMAIVERLRRAGIGTTVRAIFEARTVAGLAELKASGNL